MSLLGRRTGECPDRAIGCTAFLPGFWFSVHRWSLRRKLIVACVLVELGAMLLVLTAGSRMMQDSLQDRATAQSQQVVAVLEQVLAAPLVQRDFASVQHSAMYCRGHVAAGRLSFLDSPECVVTSIC